MTSQHRGGVGGVGEPGALEVLPDPGVRHRHVDLGATAVERVRLDRRCAVGTGELDRTGNQGVRDPVGAKNSATLRDLRVFVDQPTETVTSDDLDIALNRIGKGS